MNEEAELDTSAPSFYDFFELPVATRTSLERVAFTSTKPTHIPAFHKLKITTEERQINIYKVSLKMTVTSVSALSKLKSSSISLLHLLPMSTHGS